MGASDNWMAGLAGAASAGQDIVGRLLDYKLARKLRKETVADELELYRRKLPIQTSEELRQKQLSSDIDFKRAIALLPHQTAARKEVAGAYPTTMVDEEGYPIRTIQGRVMKMGQSVEEKEAAKFEAGKIKTKPIERSQLRSAVAELDDFEELINDLLAKPLSVATGRITYPEAFSQDRRDIDALMEQLKAKSGFSTLQEMRQNSPTGGALGQVSDREISLLQNAAAAISQKQSEYQLRKSLLKLKSIKQRSKQNFLRKYEEHYGEPFVESGGLLDISEKATRPPLENFIK